MSSSLRARSSLATLACLSAFGAFACGAPPDVAEGDDVAQSASAWTHGALDANAIEANVVVLLNGDGGKKGTCSGTLVTPRVVLTAKHCLTGQEGGSGGLSFPLRVSVGNTSSVLQTFTATLPSQAHFLLNNLDPVKFDDGLHDGESGMDVALVFLDVGQYVASGAKIVRPSLTSPRLGGSDDNGGTYNGPIGVSGWAPVDSAAGRQEVTFSSITMHHYPGEPGAGNGTPSGQYWESSTSAAAPNKGDSGGPLFAIRADGTRDVIGVLSGGNDAQTLWADVTRGITADWIRAQLVDTTRGPKWRSTHPGYAWIGELGYLGTPTIQDRDGDHWNDSNDNCPNDPNPDQNDTGDLGIGDACRRVPAPTCTFDVTCSNGVFAVCNGASGFTGTLTLEHETPLDAWQNAGGGAPPYLQYNGFSQAIVTGQGDTSPSVLTETFRACNTATFGTTCSAPVTLTLDKTACVPVPVPTPHPIGTPIHPGTKLCADGSPRHCTVVKGQALCACIDD